MSRSGILAAGNFIIDYVKLIDAWPEQDMLTNILSETSSNGGGPYNVLKDLAAMGVAYPLEACGLTGTDVNGDWILNDCKAAGIDTKQLDSDDPRAHLLHGCHDRGFDWPAHVLPSARRECEVRRDARGFLHHDRQAFSSRLSHAVGHDGPLRQRGTHPRLAGAGSREAGRPEHQRRHRQHREHPLP